MAIGTPSSVKENRIFFNATIVSVARSRARYTVPYAPEIKILKWFSDWYIFTISRNEEKIY